MLVTIVWRLQYWLVAGDSVVMVLELAVMAMLANTMPVSTLTLMMTTIALALMLVTLVFVGHVSVSSHVV